MVAHYLDHVHQAVQVMPPLRGKQYKIMIKIFSLPRMLIGHQASRDDAHHAHHIADDKVACGARVLEVSQSSLSIGVFEWASARISHSPMASTLPMCRSKMREACAPEREHVQWVNMWCATANSRHSILRFQACS
jgi:hypothetical protein